MTNDPSSDSNTEPGSPYKKDRNQRVKKPKDAKKSKKKAKKGKKPKTTNVGDTDGNGEHLCPRHGPNLNPKSKMFLRLACSHFCGAGCHNKHPECDSAAKDAIGPPITSSKYFRYRVWQSLPGCKPISDDLVSGIFHTDRMEYLVKNLATKPPKDTWQADVSPSAAVSK